jgi:general stress protein YciG
MFATDRKLARRAGRLGGLARVPKGFASDPERASRAGSIGGASSRRTEILNGQGKKWKPPARKYDPRARKRHSKSVDDIINAEIEEASLGSIRQRRRAWNQRARESMERIKDTLSIN